MTLHLSEIDICTAMDLNFLSSREAWLSEHTVGCTSPEMWVGTLDPGEYFELIIAMSTTP